MPGPENRNTLGDYSIWAPTEYPGGMAADPVSCERGSFTWAAAWEYLAGGPGEGMATVIPAVDEGLDGGDRETQPMAGYPAWRAAPRALSA